MTVLGIGLAGLGIHGSRYARHLLEGDVPGARLAAISRSNAAAGHALSREWSVPFVADPRDLATTPGVDAVVLALPPDLHGPVAEACLEAGRPVSIEKPVTADVASGEALLRRIRATGGFATVAQTLRFDPLVLALRREIGTLGPVRAVAVSKRIEPTTRTWLDDPGRGGTVLNTGVHGFDLLRFLTGAEIVHVAAETAGIRATRTEDLYVAIARLEPGPILATLDDGRITTGRSGRIEVVCDRGQVRGDLIHRWLYRVEGRDERSVGPVPDPGTVKEALKAFVEAVRTGSAPPIPVSEGLAAVRACHAAIESARLGGRVPI